MKSPIDNATPETNGDYDTPVPQTTKDNVVASGPNGEFCLVERSFRYVQFCHCIGRKTMQTLGYVCVYPLVLIPGSTNVS